ncbi:hypothetical protein [Shinella sp.]|jgi:hypothetical protein|uniref:hypothetical protein n=1 Tax=Shinella sp. TaxID=1870904 RepID=UPI0029BDAC12|nr:hypothetical protein [Shinella sp.]MDX3978139.1 hypothetical protein [Shinella sp.]
MSALDLMHRRVDLVGTVSALTARALKLTQAVSGAEMDILRLELAIDRDPANGQLVQELHNQEERTAAIREEQADCAEDIAAAEREVAALDALIAATKGE